MDYIKFAIDELEKQNEKRGITAGMAREQYAVLKASTKLEDVASWFENSGMGKLTCEQVAAIIRKWRPD